MTTTPNTILNDAERIVIKVGSTLLVDQETGEIRQEWMESLARDIMDLRSLEKQIVLVTSGAVALGRGILGLPPGPLPVEEKQAAAACGQIELAAAWKNVFAPYNVPVAQLLISGANQQSRRRYLNSRETVDHLLDHGAIPFFNENDTVITVELRVGDNDHLSAYVAQLATADCLVMLSDVDGLYTADPVKNPDAKFIEELNEVTAEIESMAGQSSTGFGTGGMNTKIAAAKIALAAGCNVLLASGTRMHPVKALWDDGKATRFVSQINPRSARKRWIAGHIHVKGDVVVDKGAEKALQSGNSLLPVGVTEIKGDFERGDPVLILSKDGRIIGRGLIAYNSQDARRIVGLHSDEVEKLLGYSGRPALIHRDDLVME